jgi:serine/threonine-protein phosphatase 2A regulatory subunit B
MKMIVYLTNSNAPFLGTESEFIVSIRSRFLSSLTITGRSVLTGSYNNYFHIYDREGTTDTVLQADKSAFKAKKIGAQKKPAAARAGQKSQVDVDSIDFSKKIL